NRAALAGLADDWSRLADVPPAWAIKFALQLAQGGAPPQAITILEHVKQTQPFSFDLDFNLAGSYLLAHDPKRALDNYDAALAIQPDSLPALKQAAAVAEGQNELERALSYWIRAKKLEPDAPETLLGFGRVCLMMDLLD